MHPAVTVVTPFFNSRQFLAETAHSILNQSLQDFEWLIIDDGSTNAEDKKCIEALSQIDERITIIRHTHNKGLSAARNTGLRCSKSDFVVFVDSDDSIEPTALEKMLWKMYCTPELGFLRGYSVGFAAEKYVMTGGFYLRDIFLADNLASNTGVMLRKSRLREIGGYNENRKTGLEDWEFWLNCAAHGVWGDNIEECVDWYRRRVTHTDRWPDYSIESRPRFFNEMKRRFPELWASPQDYFRVPSPPKFECCPTDFPSRNLLASDRPSVLILAPYLAGTQGQTLLSFTHTLRASGINSLVCAVFGKRHSLLSAFFKENTECFVLPFFLNASNFPRFLSYLSQSRNCSALINCVPEYTNFFKKDKFSKIQCIDIGSLQHKGQMREILSTLLQKGLATNSHRNTQRENSCMNLFKEQLSAPVLEKISRHNGSQTRRF